MTDHPRFIPVKGKPDEAHLNYHGGAHVEWALGIVDAVIVARRRNKALCAEGRTKAAPARNAKTRAVVVAVLALATFGVAIVLPRLLT